MRVKYFRSRPLNCDHTHFYGNSDHGYGKWSSSGVHYLKVKRLSCSWSMETDGRQALCEISIAYQPVKREIRLNPLEPPLSTPLIISWLWLNIPEPAQLNKHEMEGGPVEAFSLPGYLSVIACQTLYQKFYIVNYYAFIDHAFILIWFICYTARRNWWLVLCFCVMCVTSLTIWLQQQYSVKPTSAPSFSWRKERTGEVTGVPLLLWMPTVENNHDYSC